MLIIEPRMVIIFFSLQFNLFQMHGLLVSILGTTLNHMLLKYRCPN